MIFYDNTLLMLFTAVLATFPFEELAHVFSQKNGLC